MPRFSIVITTRNRADLTSNALRSVLDQDFADFEVVVSDNSDEAERAALIDVLGPLLADPRARLVQTPRVMAMTMHWEWAVEQARGEYIGILTDRMLLRPCALSAVNSILIAEEDPPVICYERTDLTETEAGFAAPRLKTPVTARKIACADVIAAFSRCDFKSLRNPRFLNGFHSTDFLSSLRRQYGGVFTGIAPDYGFLMRVLDQLDNYLFIDAPLLVKHSEHRSNGKGFSRLTMNSTSLDFIAIMRAEQAHFMAHGPIPEDVVMVYNAFAREYEIARRDRRRAHFPEIDRQAFYDASAGHLVRLSRNGRDVAALEASLEKYRRHWALKKYAHKPSFRELRRGIKAQLRKVFGIKPKHRAEKSGVAAFFPTMGEALRAAEPKA